MTPNTKFTVMDVSPPLESSSYLIAQDPPLDPTQSLQMKQSEQSPSSSIPIIHSSCFSEEVITLPLNNFNHQEGPDIFDDALLMGDIDLQEDIKENEDQGVVIILDDDTPKQSTTEYEESSNVLAAKRKEPDTKFEEVQQRKRIRCGTVGSWYSLSLF
jgi:hypothetical protein